MKSQIKFCKHINLFTINRPRESCRFASDFCFKNCYHAKMENLYARYKDEADKKEEAYWHQITGEQIATFLSTKRTRPTDRFRLMSRGEALTNKRDVWRIYDICMQNLDTLFMLPTKAWRSHRMMEYMKDILSSCPNLRLLFSTDPDIWSEALKVIGAHMPHPLIARMTLTYFGTDEFPADLEVFKCLKTWDKGTLVTCATCQAGCFIEDRYRLKIIHFKKH